MGGGGGGGHGARTSLTSSSSFVCRSPEAMIASSCEDPQRDFTVAVGRLAAITVSVATSGHAPRPPGRHHPRPSMPRTWPAHPPLSYCCTPIWCVLDVRADSEIVQQLGSAGPSTHLVALSFVRLGADVSEVSWSRISPSSAAPTSCVALGFTGTSSTVMLWYSPNPACTPTQAEIMKGGRGGRSQAELADVFRARVRGVWGAASRRTRPMRSPRPCWCPAET